MPSDRERWNARHLESAELRPPDALLVEATRDWIAPRYPHGGRALDLAGGRGQNSLYLAQQAWRVTLVDVSDRAIEDARRQAGEQGLPLQGVLADAGDFLRSVAAADFDLVMVFFFLERALFSELRRVLRPGGILVYKTYTIDQLQHRRGLSNPDYLLRPGELRAAFSDFELLHARETTQDPAVAELVAIRR